MSRAALPSNIDLAFEWVTGYANPSIAGQGGDDSLFAAACALVNGFDLDEGQALAALAHYNQTKCSPCWPESRLKHKVAQARTVRHEHAPGGLARWLLREKGLVARYEPGEGRRADAGVAPEPRREIIKARFDYQKLVDRQRADWNVNEAWFAERSPVPVEGMSPVDYLGHVFGPNEKIIVFTKFASQGQYIVWTGRGVFRLGQEDGIKAVESKLPAGTEDGVWYLCNPVDGKWHPNPRGALVRGQVPLSRRAKESVTKWSHLVLECDHKEKACDCDDCNGRDNPGIHNLWLNYLAQLRLPVVALYTSAGKSVHALIRVDADSKEQWDRFRAIMLDVMITHGADRKAMTAVRLTRLPGCMRGNRLQKLLYLNPRPDEKGVPIGLGGNVCA